MRVVWILAMLAGLLVFGSLAVLRLYGLYMQRDDPSFAALIPSGLLWSFLFLFGAGACAAGAFMSPREFQEATKPLPVKRAAWLDEPNPNAPPDKRRDGDD